MKKSGMFKKRDLLLCLGILLAAGAVYLATRIPALGKKPANTVRILVNGQVYAEEPLGEERDILVTQANGAENVVHLTENGFYMARSTCTNQLCVYQGDVTEENYSTRFLGTHVLCLPNRVDVELVLTTQDEAPVDPDAPDI